MGKFVPYVALSAAAAALTFYYAMKSRRQFYQAANFLVHNKISIVIFGNAALVTLFAIGELIKTLFFGVLTIDEVEEIVQNSKYAITETFLAMTIFRDEFTPSVLALFAFLLFFKTFHWLAILRVEAMAREGSVTLKMHVRMQALFAMLAGVDILFVALICERMLGQRTVSVLLLFAFEFAIMYATLLSVVAKYIVLVIDLRHEGHWRHKSTSTFYIDLATDVVRLLLYMCFFSLICMYYGLPLHLIREIYITVHSLRERIVKFIAYRKLTSNMNSRFPDATAEDIERVGDETCIVCREEMIIGNSKKLPCGHLFHFECLRTWLERSQSCPTCRAEIPTQQPVARRVSLHPQNQAPIISANGSAAEPVRNMQNPTLERSNTQTEPSLKASGEAVTSNMSFLGKLAFTHSENDTKPKNTDERRPMSFEKFVSQMPEYVSSPINLLHNDALSVHQRLALVRASSALAHSQLLYVQAQQKQLEDVIERHHELQRQLELVVETIDTASVINQQTDEDEIMPELTMSS